MDRKRNLIGILARHRLGFCQQSEKLQCNAEIRNLGPTLMQLTSISTFHLTPHDQPARALKGTPIKNITRAETDPLNDYLIGNFRHKDGRRAVLINNYRFAYTAWPTVEFDVDPALVTEIDKATGKERPVRDDSPDMPGEFQSRIE